MPRTTYVILAIITLFTQAFTPAASLYTTEASAPQYIHASPSLPPPAPWSVIGVIDGLSSRSDTVKGYAEAVTSGGVVGVMAAPDYTTEPDTPNYIVVDQAGRVTQHRAWIDGEVIFDVESSEGVLYAAGTQTYSSPRHDLIIYRYRGSGWEKVCIHPDPEGDVGINMKILVYGDVFLAGYDVRINGSKKTAIAAYSYNGDTCTLLWRRVVERKPWLLLRYGGKAMFVRTLCGSSSCNITVEVLSPASGAVVDTRTHTVERDARVFPIKSLDDSLDTFGYVAWDGHEIHVYEPSTATWRTHSVANPIHMIMGGSRRGRYYVVVYGTRSSRRFLDTMGVEGWRLYATDLAGHEHYIYYAPRGSAAYAAYTRMIAALGYSYLVVPIRIPSSTESIVMVYFWANSPGLVGKSMRVLIPVPRGTLCIDGACYGYYDNEYAEVELYPGKHYIMIRTASYVAIVEADVSSSINGNVLDTKSHAATLIHLVLSGASGDRLYIDGQLAAIIGRDPSPTTLYIGTSIHIGVSGQGCTVKTVAANGTVTGAWPCTALQATGSIFPSSWRWPSPSAASQHGGTGGGQAPSSQPHHPQQPGTQQSQQPHNSSPSGQAQSSGSKDIVISEEKPVIGARTVFAIVAIGLAVAATAAIIIYQLSR